ncbi:peptidoglycan DD-metalloendopeptidase family protein [Streptomyces syringium]|uniref:M23 family metallopeptidase n=1 Tax=Streptomyces syringium TaxID=76729 RepID=UPI0037CD9DB5
MLCALCLAVCPLGTPGALGTPDASAASPAARAPDRLVRVSSEVFRLAGEAGRARQRYETEVREVTEQTAGVRRVARQLRQQRIVSSALREDAGAAARAQYRTGGFTAAKAPAAASDDPVELLGSQSPAERRRELLAAALGETDRRSRELAAREQAAAASWPAAEEDLARLRAERRVADRRLAAARGRLDAMARAAIARGRCEPLDREKFTAAAGAYGPAAVDTAGAAEEAEWARPVLEYELSAGYRDSGASWARGHTGQDFAVPTGTPVRSVGAGTVVSAGCGGPFGISLVIRHSGGWYSQYAHLSASFVAPGDQVLPGQWIGLSGTTGNSTGPHLHFEIRTKPGYGSAVDPVAWLRVRGVRL